MRIRQGDTVIIGDNSHAVAIVERHNGSELVIRRPDEGNQRAIVDRKEVRLLAAVMHAARERGTKFRNDLSLTGESTMADLVNAFGYSVGQMRQESLGRVSRQLERAGLDMKTLTGGWNRDDRFALMLKAVIPDEGEEPTGEVAPVELPVSLPELFWPRALGLSDGRELAFLRALTEREPLLCLLRLPENSAIQSWLQPTWEGLTAWAYRAAQRFVWKPSGENAAPEVQAGPAALLHTYLKPSVLSSEGPNLAERLHSINLITLKQDSDSPVDFSRLKATWPGPLFEFDGSRVSTDAGSILELLMTVGGKPRKAGEKLPPGLSPLKMLLWCREACSQVMARVTAGAGQMLASEPLQKFKGSNEGDMAVALKMYLAQWLRKNNPKVTLRFEKRQMEATGEDERDERTTRVDLSIEGQSFEVETMVGSGPMETFYHQKVFSRLKQDTKFTLVAPSESLLWAGPYLADIAHHLGSRGRVLVPGAEDTFLSIQPQPLDAQSAEVENPIESAIVEFPLRDDKKQSEDPLKLSGIAGYKAVLGHIQRNIIWPERHSHLLRGISRAPGILFFGPPGCGKSRLARAIAGELEQEVRLLGPSDLRGAYVGWGQIQIREQFDWVAERERRMLIIDELDAIARSRSDDMINDEKASVNELLVQLDRASRLGRLVVGTTNYIDSLDDAVVRSGRFGRFIPIPPPDIDESVAILTYYLGRLFSSESGTKRPTLVVPNASALREMLEPLHEANILARRFFCGADLEAAVNETFVRCLQRALPDETSLVEALTCTIDISTQELRTSLETCPRSIQKEAFDRFIQDVSRYCGQELASDMMRRLKREELRP
jgi:SpoVK/Ycf46/Vps4 family AAA+-type ATPase